jgi:hypothetical protein
MKRFLIGTLGLSLAWLTPSTQAEELIWRAASPPAVQPGAARPAAQPASLGKPVAVVQAASWETDAGRAADPGVRRAGFLSPGVGAQEPVVRGQMAEERPERLPDPSATNPPKAETVDVATTNFASEAAPPEKGPDGLACPVVDGVPLCCVGAPECCEGMPCANAGQAPAGPRFYAQGEYLLWWIRSSRVPPLVTTGPFVPTTSVTSLMPGQNGILGPGTTILLGQRALDNEERSGTRVTAGYWLDDCRTLGVEASFFFLPDRSGTFAVNSGQVPGGLLARPFFNLNFGQEFSQIVTAPGQSTGSVTTSLASRLWGANADVRCNLCAGCNYRLDAIGGFQYLDLRESLQVREDIMVLPTSPTFANDRVLVIDSFATHNHFYGGELGLAGEYRLGPWSVEARGKVGLGSTHEVVDINGSQLITTPTGMATSFRGGLLALPSNIGHFTRDSFAVVPQLNVNLGYQITSFLRAFVGYDFLYWSKVLRPGDQIDRVLDISQIPNFIPGVPPTGQARPAVPFKETGFWAQGINFGLEFKF